MEKENNFLDVDIFSLSHENLVDIIKQLKNGQHNAVKIKAQKELIKRLKDKGFSNKKIAMILTANVYGIRKRLLIAKEWAEALEISEKEFMRLIGK